MTHQSLKLKYSFFVEKAEDRLIKELDDPGLDNYSTFSFTASDPVVSLPADALVIRNVNYTTSVSTTDVPAIQKLIYYKELMNMQ